MQLCSSVSDDTELCLHLADTESHQADIRTQCTAGFIVQAGVTLSVSSY